MNTILLLTLAQISEYAFYVIIALAILLLMITIHEFGHYIVGKLLKFKIDEFSIGFGSAIYSKKAKNGEVFSVRLIPLGGYCAFHGEDGIDEESNKNDENTNIPNETKVKEKKFTDHAPWKRILVLISGVFFNFLSAIIFSAILLVGFGYDIPQIKSIDQFSVNSHLSVGDIITHVEGEKVDYIYGSTLNELLNKYLADEMNITVLRDGESIDTVLYVDKVQVDGKETSSLQMTIGPYQHTLGEALVRCVPLTFTFAGKIFEFLGLLFTGQVALSSITGPVTTITTIVSYTQESLANLFVFLPFISVNLAIFNILPIPSLDGSRVIFTGIEWIRGKPINRKVENMVHMIGLIALLALVVFVDLFHIFT